MPEFSAVPSASVRSSSYFLDFPLLFISSLSFSAHFVPVLSGFCFPIYDVKSLSKGEPVTVHGVNSKGELIYDHRKIPKIAAAS